MAVKRGKPNMRHDSKSELNLTGQPLTEPLPERPVPSSEQINAMIARVRRYLLDPANLLFVDAHLSSADADDTAVEAVLRTYEKWRESTQEWHNLNRFAVTVARNLLIDQIRKNKKIVSLDSDLPIWEEIVTDNQRNLVNPTEKKFVSQERLRSVLNKLAEKDRSILTLTMEGYTQSEIAKKLGMTQPAISERLKKIGEIKEIQALFDRDSPE
jgi:RNA polymerase sigma factor (sigma-70 family)